MIAMHLDIPALSALARSTKALHRLLTYQLYRLALNRSEPGGPYFAWAASSGLVSAVRIFIEVGASVSEMDAWGWTALHFCIANGHEAVARLLIDKGADASAAGWHGISPLHVAIYHRWGAMVSLLVDAGAVVPSDAVKL
jgi:ankyrin repeat protein